MKVHARKKLYQQFCKEQANAGRINNAAGQWIARNQAADNSMKQNYYPQEG